MGRKSRRKREARERVAEWGISPDFPADELERLRKVREHIDPFQTYRLEMPDGSIRETTGADLIASAEAIVSVVDCIGRGDDPRVIAAAFDRLFRT